MELQQIPVKDIHRNPAQPRRKLAAADVQDLLQSMPKVGLLQSILIGKNGGDGYVLLAGERRLTAATILEWETIEAKVVDISDPKLNIAKIMAENEARQDLSGQEKQAGYQTMIDMGWSDEDMQAITGASPEEITAVRKISTGKKKVVAKMPATASLEEMAALLEFEKDKDATRRLEQALGTDNFPHVLSQMRQSREVRRKNEEALAQLKQEGTRVIDRSETWGTKPFYRLDHPQIKEPPEEHAACPGHCAYVDQGKIHYFCSAPKEHGIATSGGGTPKTEEQKKEDKLKRALRVLWRASAPVRQEFIIGKLKAKKVNAGLFDWTIAWAAEHGLDAFMAHNSKSGTYTDSKDSKVRVVAVAVATAEKYLEDWVTYSGAVGKPHVDGTLAYLKVLGEMGYPLSDHEKAAIAGKPFDPEKVKA